MALPIRHEHDLDDVSDLPQLPAAVWSMDGQVVHTHSDVWTCRTSADGGRLLHINWSRFTGSSSPSMLSLRAVYLAKLYAAHALTRYKCSTVYGAFQAIASLDRWLQANADTALPGRPPQSFNWLDYSESIGRAFVRYGIEQTAEKGQHFSFLRSFYRWGVAQQYPDFDPLVLQLLEGIRAPGHAKGHHVRFRHPTKGPFSPDEQHLITRSLAARVGADRDRAIVMLHLELGPNPHAVVRLLRKDLRRYAIEKGVVYQLDLPRVKKRTERRETKRRAISPQLGQLLEALQHGDPDTPLLSWLNPDNPESGIHTAMQQFVRAASLTSPVTGKLLHMTPRRFRYTLATHMAEEGASNFEIAEVLDHSDLQNVKVYTQTTSTITDQVAEATDAALTPLVNRFLGIIVESTATQAFSDVPNQLIPAAMPLLPLPLLKTSVGLCGRDVRKDGLCQLFPPYSCYLCFKFAALRTGPHREMLDAIDAYIRAGENILAPRILQQLDEIRMAIRDVLARLGDVEVTGTDKHPTTNKETIS